MHIKHLKHGKGKAAKAAKYLMHDTKAAHVRVLKGDPNMVAQVADSLKFQYKYTSGVIAWHKDDKPTPQQIDDILKGYEELCFAGLDPERYCFSAVQHIEEDGSTHVHTFAARVDLATGKSFNPAPPGHLKDMDSLRDLANEIYQWARPDDPLLAKAQTFGSLNTPKATREAKEYITNGLLQMVSKGLIKNRNDVLNTLTTGGFEVVRETDKSISIANPQGGRNIRFTGALYERSFTSEQTISRADKAERERSSQNHQQRIQELRESFTQAHNRRSEYNRKRYKRPDSPQQTAVKAPQHQADISVYNRLDNGRDFNIGDSVRAYKVKRAEQTANVQISRPIGAILHDRIRNLTSQFTGAVKRAHDAVRKRFERYAQADEHHQLEQRTKPERMRDLQTRDVDNVRKQSGPTKLGL